MRDDMFCVIIDRPRTGGDGGKSILPKGTKKRLQKQMNSEDTISYESSARRRVYGYDCKQLNEHLTPLSRWMGKQVGRKWDDVWSEVCDGLSIRNATTAHVRDHADMFVEKNCKMVDGVLCDSKGSPLNKSGWRWYRFYVDPRDETLQEFGDRPKYRYEKRRKANFVEGKDENHAYYLIDDIWYEVEFKPFPVVKTWAGEIANHHRIWDLVISCSWMNDNHKYSGSYRSDCEGFHGRSVYAASKHQLNKKEIRKLKLWEKLKK